MKKWLSKMCNDKAFAQLVGDWWFKFLAHNLTELLIFKQVVV